MLKSFDLIVLALLTKHSVREEKVVLCKDNTPEGQVAEITIVVKCVNWRRNSLLTVLKGFSYPFILRTLKVLCATCSFHRFYPRTNG